MKKYKGFSLIEILLVLGVLAMIAVSTFFIYGKISINQKINTISNDMSYAGGEYRNMVGNMPLNYFSVGEQCCEMSPAIHSSFKLISESPSLDMASKSYRGAGYDINISAGTSPDNAGYLIYSIYGINNNIGGSELCTKLIMKNIVSADSVYLSTSGNHFSKNGGDVYGRKTKKATLKEISALCEKEQYGKNIQFYYYPQS